MADITRFMEEYSAYKSTFKMTSFDNDNGVSLCPDERQVVINFDKLIEERYPRATNRPKSFDALYIDNADIYCIEFKNQKPTLLNCADIKGKLESGKRELDTFLDTLEIPQDDYNFIYCICYQNWREPRDRYKYGIIKSAIQFDVEQYQEQGFVKEIYTNDVLFFTKQLQRKTQRA